MKPRKTLALLALSVAASTPAFSQIFWTNQSPAGITDQIWCVTYGSGTFAAVTNLGKVLTSTDGLTWSSQTVAGGTWLVSIGYGGGKWVAVGASGTILVSSDLQTWVSATAVTPNRLNGVLYNGSVWVAVGEAATVITSPDAINWTVQPVPPALGVAGFLHGITWDPVNSVFLISGELTATQPVDSGGQGVMFQLAVSGSTVTMSPAITANYPLEAVLYESVASPNTVAVGDDGLVISGNYAAPGGGTGAVPDVTYRGLAYGNGFWVAAGGNDPGGNGGTIVTSTDGLNWTQRFTGDSPSTQVGAEFLSATYSPVLQRFVVAGIGGAILVSNTAPTTFANVSTRGYVSSTQTFIGGFVIEGSGARTVLIRGDGPVLSTFSVPNPLPDPVLTVYDNSGNVIATNTGWTTNANPTSISTAALEVGAFTLPNPSPDSALLLTLQPGAYTAQITSASGASGIALFEAYTN